MVKAKTASQRDEERISMMAKKLLKALMASPTDSEGKE